MSQNIFMHIIFSKYMHVCVFKYTTHTYKYYVNKTFILDVINRLSALIRRNSQQRIVWLAIIHFYFMTKNIRILCSMKIFLYHKYIQIFF